MATYYDWDEIEDNIDEEYDENGNTIVEYTTEPTLYGSVISQNRGGVTSHYHFDGLGNTTELTDESGNVTDSRRYSAFGEVTESTGGTSLSYGFGGAFGYYRDLAAEHIVIRSRPYLPAIARWASHDPLRLLALMDPLGDLNHYTYCSNSPLTYSDPSGLLAGGCPSDAVIWAKMAAFFLAGQSWKCAWGTLPNTTIMPYQHCLWQCRLRRDSGLAVAEECELQKEEVDLKICNLAKNLAPGCFDGLSQGLKTLLADACCSAHQPSDYRDNETGRKCGKPPSLYENPVIWLVSYACGYRYELKLEKRKSCKECCNENGLDDNTKEGPGTTRPCGPNMPKEWEKHLGVVRQAAKN